MCNRNPVTVAGQHTAKPGGPENCRSFHSFKPLPRASIWKNEFWAKPAVRVPAPVRHGDDNAGTAEDQQAKGGSEAPPSTGSKRATVGTNRAVQCSPLHRFPEPR